jgi:hypothetical protein
MWTFFSNISISKGQIIACVLLAVTFSAGYFYIKAIRADNQRLAFENEINKAAISSLTIAVKNNYLALEEREAVKKEIAAETEAKKKAFEEVKDKSEEACIWASTPIPDDVLKFLCQTN